MEPGRMPQERHIARTSARRVPIAEAATLADIESHIQGLTDADVARLSKYAGYRIWKLGPKAGSQTRDDLLQTALIDVLQDKRRWPKERVDFLSFLEKAMRSISSNWARTYSPENVPILESDLLREDEEGVAFSPLSNLPAKGTNVEQLLEDAQTLEQIDRLFEGDEDVQKLLMAFDDGRDPDATRKLWDLSQQDYNRIIRRLRRGTEKAGLTANRN